MLTADEPRLTFLVGGARSGKSRMAVEMASGDGDVVFLATASPSDEEMARRVERHRAERPDDWLTLEAPLDLAGTIRDEVPADATVVLDCLTLWVSNLLAARVEDDDGEGGQDGRDVEEHVLSRTEEVLSCIGERGRRWLVVSNEVGTGLHPNTALGRCYRDLLGLVNQRVSRAADRAYLVVAGRTLTLERPAGV